MNRLTDEEKINLVKLYKTGDYGCTKLSKIFGITPDSVRGLLKRRNIYKKRNSYKDRKYTLDENYFLNIDSENKAYFLGLMYADGCNFQNRIFSLGLKFEDRILIQKFKEELKTNCPTYIYKHKNKKDHYRIRIASKKICKDLSNLGCVPKKSFILQFPTEEQVSNNLIRHFIRGYFDGDGCIVIYNNKPQCSIVSSKDFCLRVKDILYENLSVKSSIHNKNKVAQLNILGGKIDIYKFLDWIYKDSKVYLDRKYNKYLEITGALPLHTS